MTINFPLTLKEKTSGVSLQLIMAVAFIKLLTAEKQIDSFLFRRNVPLGTEILTLLIWKECFEMEDITGVWREPRSTRKDFLFSLETISREPVCLHLLLARRRFITISINLLLKIIWIPFSKWMDWVRLLNQVRKYTKSMVWRRITHTERPEWELCQEFSQTERKILLHEAHHVECKLGSLYSL